MALLFPHRDSPLISAARHGLVRDVEDLLAYGADVNQAHRGTTPLYIACQEGPRRCRHDAARGRRERRRKPCYKGHAEVAAKLIAANANVDQRTTNRGTTPLSAGA